jgi:hypothetical protein
MASPPNCMVVPTITYEYLFCLLSSERLRPPARRKAWGLLLGSYTLGTAGHRLWPKNLDMIGSLQWQMAREPITPYRIRPHHSWLKKRGRQLKNN